MPTASKKASSTHNTPQTRARYRAFKASEEREIMSQVSLWGLPRCLDVVLRSTGDGIGSIATSPLA